MSTLPFLDIDEGTFRDLLWTVPPFTDYEARSRSSLLENAGLEWFANNVTLTGGRSGFFQELYSALCRRSISRGDVKRLGIIVLLEHVISLDRRLDLPKETVETFLAIIKRYEDWRSQGAAEPADDRAGLTNRLVPPPTIVPVGVAEPASQDELGMRIAYFEQRLDALWSERDALPFTPEVDDLQAQIEECKREYDAALQKREDLYVTRVYTAMLRMNHKPYTDAFAEFIQAHRVGAFLIHGARRHGHLWLLKRLLNVVPSPPQPTLIPFDFASRGQRRDVGALWNNLAYRLKMPTLGVMRSEIAERLAQLLRTRSVILTALGVEQTSEVGLRQVIEEFWQPLVQAVQPRLPSATRTVLVMFLVDFEDLVITWDVPVAPMVGPAPETRFPIRLEKLARFSASEVQLWMERNRSLFPARRRALIGETVQEILQDSDDGVPEGVAEQVCRICEVPYQGEDKWLYLETTPS